MKRMIAFILTAMLMMSVTANVYGEENKTTVEYVVSDSYEISIPETILANETNTITVGISNKTSSDRVAVSVSSRNVDPYTGKFLLLHSDNPNLTIEYTLSVDGYPLTGNNMQIGEFTTDYSITLNVNVMNGRYASGRYTDILTFNFG